MRGVSDTPTTICMLERGWTKCTGKAQQFREGNVHTAQQQWSDNVEGATYSKHGDEQPPTSTCIGLPLTHALTLPLPATRYL